MYFYRNLSLEHGKIQKRYKKEYNTDRHFDRWLQKDGQGQCSQLKLSQWPRNPGKTTCPGGKATKKVHTVFCSIAENIEKKMRMIKVATCYEITELFWLSVCQTLKYEKIQ